VSDLATIDYANGAFKDIERLDEFLTQQDSPLRGQLAAFIAKAVTILAIQPGIGRPVSDSQRELIVHRGRSGYLVRYRYDRTQQTVTVLRIRHQNESGYTANEI
jgi:plasmid stabilization system protein ParE